MHLKLPGHADAINLIGLKLTCREKPHAAQHLGDPAGQHSHHQATSAARFINMHMRFICLAISNNGGFTGELTLSAVINHMDMMQD